MRRKFVAMLLSFSVFNVRAAETLKLEDLPKFVSAAVTDSLKAENQNSGYLISIADRYPVTSSLLFIRQGKIYQLSRYDARFVYALKRAPAFALQNISKWPLHNLGDEKHAVGWSVSTEIRVQKTDQLGALHLGRIFIRNGEALERGESVSFSENVNLLKFSTPANLQPAADVQPLTIEQVSNAVDAHNELALELRASDAKAKIIVAAALGVVILGCSGALIEILDNCLKNAH